MSPAQHKHAEPEGGRGSLRARLLIIALLFLGLAGIIAGLGVPAIHHP
jgi:hypothetical protein